jgi:hypothetical protein
MRVIPLAEPPKPEPIQTPWTPQDALTKQEFLEKRRELIRETNLDEIAASYGLTIKQDKTALAVTFLACLNTYTNRHSLAVMFKAPSSTGKSYIPLQVVTLFPKEDIITLAGASATSFFHDQRQPVEEVVTKADGTPKLGKQGLPLKRVAYYLVNLERKVIVFVDMPDYKLLERLRAFVSKDQKTLDYQITDRTASGSHRTKFIRLVGFSTFIYCSAKQTAEDQENTRNLILSPETTQDKLKEAIHLITTDETDHQALQSLIETDPQRVCLRERIRAIRDAHIQEANLTPEDSKYLEEEFLRRHPHLLPRHCRDYPRVTALAKGHALLNLWQRRKNPDDKVIQATRHDIDTALNLYDSISEANEIGLSPYLYNWYKQILLPFWEKTVFPDMRLIMRRHLEVYHEPLNRNTLQRDIMPALEAAALVSPETDSIDRRKTVYMPVKGTEGQTSLDGA